MPIYYGGDSRIKDVRVGSTKIKELYKGSELKWRAGFSNVVYIIDPNDRSSPSTYGVPPIEQLDREFKARGLSRMTLTEIPFTIDLSKTTTVSALFHNCGLLKEVPSIVNTTDVSDITYMFSKCSSLTEIPEFDFPNVTRANHAFSQCTSLTDVGPIKFDQTDVNLTDIFAGSTSLDENKVILGKSSWWKWWDSDSTNTSNLGVRFKYPPFYDNSGNHIPHVYQTTNTVGVVKKTTVDVPSWAKFANLFIVSAGRAGQNGNGGNRANGLGGGTAGMFVQTNIPVTASSTVTTKLEKQSYPADGSFQHPPNTDYTYVYIDDVAREAIGSRLQNSGVSTNQHGSTISFDFPGIWTPKGLLLGDYNVEKSGRSLGWGILNGTYTLRADESPHVYIQDMVETGPGGAPDGGNGEFGAGGAGGNGGIFNRFTKGGVGGPPLVRIVFSSVDSREW